MAEVALGHVGVIGGFRGKVKRGLLAFSGGFCYTSGPMVRAETLDDLLDAAGLPLSVFAKRAKIDPTSLLALRRGTVDRPRVATVTKLAAALKVDVARVRAACEASRAAAEKG